MAMDITKGSTRVFIDPKRCIANAKCTTAAPGVYALDEETGVAVIENPDDATVEQLFAGARACPTQAIIIEQFGRRVYPVILTPMFGESERRSGARRRVARQPEDLRRALHANRYSGVGNRRQYRCGGSSEGRVVEIFPRTTRRAHDGRLHSPSGPVRSTRLRSAWHTCRVP